MKKNNFIYLSLFIVMIILLISCNLYMPQFTLKEKKDAFKNDFNSRIGHTLHDPHLSSYDFEKLVYAKRELGTNTTEWLLKLWNGCKIGVTIRDSDKVVLGWRYISNPDNCLLIYGGGL